MDAIAQVVKDIIDLKYEASNLQHDATMENMYEWYSWALFHGIVEVTYRYGELQGFIEWIRLKEVPETRDEAVESVDFDTTGPILYIANCCVRDDGKRHGVMWKLIHMVREKNPDAEIFCWHEDADNLKVYENTKSEGVRV